MPFRSKFVGRSSAPKQQSTLMHKSNAESEGALKENGSSKQDLNEENSAHSHAVEEEKVRNDY